MLGKLLRFFYSKIESDQNQKNVFTPIVRGFGLWKQLSQAVEL